MDDITFELLPEHIALLRGFYVEWDDREFGAPCIDPKRPYGNNEVYVDMIDILGIDKPLVLTETRKRQLRDLHRSLEMALQIILDTGAFKVGVYRKHCYGNRWRLDPK